MEKRRLLYSSVGFLLGALSFYAFFLNFPRVFVPPSQAETSAEKHLGPIGLINPLLACPEWQDHNEPPRFESELEKEVNSLLKAGRALNIGVYARKLEGGPWFGAFEDSSFYPGSLLKLPQMVGYFKRSDTDPTILQEKVKFTDRSLLRLYEVQGVQPSRKLEIGEEFTVLELIERSVIYSDNVAANLLEQFDKNASLLRVSKDLMLDFSSGPRENRLFSPRDYGSFFRILYNASYLSTEKSNLALSILSRSEYREGLGAKLPPDVLVAHKFGESVERSSGIHQFHDCGIVYAKQGPYLICIMTRGRDAKALPQLIGDLSVFVYDRIDR